MNTTDDLPFARTWWIEEDKVIGGRFPGALDENESHQMMRALIKARVGLIVNLQEPGEIGANNMSFPDYTVWMNSIAQETDHEIKMINVPIKDMGVTSAENVKLALDAIDQALSEGKLVYVHCWGGHGRTGTIAGCLLKRRGMKADDIFQLIKTRRAHDSHLASYLSPQTDAQREMVENWSEL